MALTKWRLESTKSKSPLLGCYQTTEPRINKLLLYLFPWLIDQGVANKNRRCALCRRDIPIECLEHPQLVRGTKDLNNSNSNDFRWFYEGRNGECAGGLYVVYVFRLFGQKHLLPRLHSNYVVFQDKFDPNPNPCSGLLVVLFQGGWWAYESRSAQELEEHYKNDPQSSFELLISGSLYCIDLAAMKQFRKGDSHRRRSIKRETDSKFWIKGVAGISKLNTNHTPL